MKPAVLLLLVFLQSLQLQAQISPLAGTWVMDVSGVSMTLELKPDGTGSLEREQFTWSAKDGVLITVDDEGTAYYQYTINQNTLTIADEKGMVLSFKKKQNSNTTTSSASTKPAVLNVSPSSPSDNKLTSAASKALIGYWRNDQANLEFRSDGMMLVNGTQYKYEVTSPGIVSITGNDGSVFIPYSITDNKLTVTMNGQSALYTKTTVPVAKAAPVGGSVSQELSGKWCYMVNIYSNNGGTMKDECFTLNGDGSYTYKYESSSSNAYGSVASQDFDQGTWKASGNQIHVQSTKGTQSSYTFEKKNHPKTGDPMLIIDGRAFVTAFNKAPWK